MATTTNFGWETPDDTDLVKDGALAMRTLGSAIDTSLVDLKGGTTGQVLSKTSNTDMDFTWATPQVGDITAVNVTSPITGGGTTGDVTIGIQDGTTAQKGAVQLENSTSSTSTTTAAVPASVKSAFDLANAAIPKNTITTNGDLIYGTGSSAVARLGIGSTGQILTVSGGIPSWATPASSGGYTLLTSGSHSGTTLTFSSISSSYVDLYLIMDGIDVSTNTNLRLRFNNDTTANRHAHNFTADNTGASFGATSSQLTGTISTTGSNSQCFVSVPNYNSTNSWRSGTAVYLGMGQVAGEWIGGRSQLAYNQTTAITRLDIFEAAAGTFACSYKLYGVK